jgi:hypothetical protein
MLVVNEYLTGHLPVDGEKGDTTGLTLREASIDRNLDQKED